ncbi:F-box family protein [Euphorbia peplus]|nr:F-box family protein [Euphorbia peplus]
MTSTKRSNIISSPALSAEIIANNEDLILEILSRLPVKSLMKFKSVSKHWLSLITNPNFSRHGYLPSSPCACGLFLHTWLHPHNTFHFINLDCQHSNRPLETLTSVDYPPEIIIIQSCNGLLLCSSFPSSSYSKEYYVCNPTTKHRHMLPRFTPFSSFRNLFIAFDPSNSPDYKVIGICGGFEREETDDNDEIRIYSSKSGTWRLSEARISLKLEPAGGVFWNGGIHWYTNSGLCLYFDVVKEEIKEIAMPNPIPDNWQWHQRSVYYFGASRGHLHLIQIYHPPSTQFGAWEMKNDKSGWSLKYKVNLDGIVSKFPGMIRSFLDPSELDYYAFEILCIVEAETEEDESYMVLHIPKNVLRYNLKTRTFKKLCDFPQEDSSDDDESGADFHHSYAHPYIESLVSV